jgi:hypothetical protein
METKFLHSAANFELNYMYHICPYIICTGEYYAPLLTENLGKSKEMYTRWLCLHVPYISVDYHSWTKRFKERVLKSKTQIFWLHECHTHRLLIVQKKGWRAEHFYILHIYIYVCSATKLNNWIGCLYTYVN